MPSVIPFALILILCLLLINIFDWVVRIWLFSQLKIVATISSLVFDAIVYLSAFFIVLIFVLTRKNNKKETKSFTKVVIISAVILIIFEAAFFPSAFQSSVQRIKSEILPKIVDSCPDINKSPRIVYTGTGGFGYSGLYFSDMNGNNLSHLALPDAVADLTSRGFSPDGSMIALSAKDNEIWLYCVDTSGYIPIKLPDFSPELDKSKIGNYYDISSTSSWSPDSSKLILNHGGDIVLLDLKTKESKIIVKSVALRKNDINYKPQGYTSTRPYVTSLYQIGDAIWGSSNDEIYYDSFKDDTVILHKLNIKTNQDELVDTFHGYLSFYGINSDDSKLYIRMIDWPDKPTKNIDDSFIYNPQTKTKGADIYQNLGLIPVQHLQTYVGDQGGSTFWQNDPTAENPSFLATLQKSNPQVNVTDLLAVALSDAGIDQSVGISLRGYADHMYLIHIFNRSNESMLPGSINATFDENNKIHILQIYPQRSYSEIRPGLELESQRIIN